MTPALKGFLIAPIVPNVLFIPIGFILVGPNTTLFIFLVSSPLFYFKSVLFGVPVHLLLVRFRRYGLIDYAFGGAVASLVSSCVGGVQIEFENPQTWLLWTSLVAFAGGLVGSTFWLIARPDRSQ